jgi:hypothetical protein
VAALLDVTVDEVQRLIERGELPLEDGGIPRDAVRKHMAYQAFLPGNDAFSLVEGESNQALPRVACVGCLEKGSVAYRGSEVVEGLLELSHLIHVEVEHRFECSACGASWKRSKFL